MCLCVCEMRRGGHRWLWPEAVEVLQLNVEAATHTHTHTHTQRRLSVGGLFTYSIQTHEHTLYRRGQKATCIANIH